MAALGAGIFQGLWVLKWVIVKGFKRIASGVGLPEFKAWPLNWPAT